jgi:hypothetical protein
MTSLQKPAFEHEIQPLFLTFPCRKENGVIVSSIFINQPNPQDIHPDGMAHQVFL